MGFYLGEKEAKYVNRIDQLKRANDSLVIILTLISDKMLCII